MPPGAGYQCWVDAGGGTTSYDADRYLALLRDRGILKPRRGLVEILTVVIQDRTTAEGGKPWDEDELRAEAEAFARLLVDELGKDGYRVHDVALCVRPGDPAGVGRPMTPEEERQVGLWEGR